MSMPQAFPATARVSSPPQYLGLAFISVVVRVVGWLEVVGGALIIALAFAGGASMSHYSHEVGPAVSGTSFGIGAGIAAVLSGLLVVGFGEVFSALRDIARNSFRH